MSRSDGYGIRRRSLASSVRHTGAYSFGNDEFAGVRDSFSASAAFYSVVKDRTCKLFTSRGTATRARSFDSCPGISRQAAGQLARRAGSRLFPTPSRAKPKDARAEDPGHSYWADGF